MDLLVLFTLYENLNHKLNFLLMDLLFLIYFFLSINWISLCKSLLSGTGDRKAKEIQALATDGFIVAAASIGNQNGKILPNM